MEVITSHTNADFDALASMVAAKKLYPRATIVFAGSQEQTMRTFFVESTQYAIESERLKNIDVEKISRLILVDNRNARRLGKLAGALQNPGISVHIYDHHPLAEGDIRGELEVVEEVGATTTVMMELLQQKNIPITPLEATIFALGIYEETGSLTYVSTTERDARATAYVISRGANLNVVSDFLSRELTAEQIAVMNDLLRSAKSYDINGVRLVIAALATPHFIPDLAALAHRIRDAESLDVLFLVVQMGDKTHIIARCRIPQVDAGAVLEQLGGGGHRTAASAVVRDLTYLQSVERLIDILKQHIKPGKTARQIMTSSVKTVAAGSSISQAGEAMTRFSVNVLPVLRGGFFQGIITREVVQKALFHGLGDHPVEQFMTTGVITATPDMPMDKVERMMLEERQRFIPVLDQDDAIIGAITRTDLLRSLHEERLAETREPASAKFPSLKNVRGVIEERLPAAVREALKEVGRIADASGTPVYLVGGIVRDLFLRVANDDIDIVVEGDGITFAGMLVKEKAGRMKTHQKFGTAVVLLPEGLKLDIATARLEYYESPAALPTIELSSIKKDLYRRDFTINTLAVRLNTKHFGELIDFFGGVRDIKEKAIRILHNLSFVEDPTRVYRAIRFEQRFGFHISKHTLNLIKTSVSMRLFDKLSGERVMGELMPMFGESDPGRVVKRMNELGLLKFIHPELKYGVEMERLFAGIGEALSWFRLLYLDSKPDIWFVYFLGFLDRLKDESVEEIFARLSIPSRLRSRCRSARKYVREALFTFYRNPNLSNSRVYDLLKTLDLEPILLMMAKSKRESTRKYISHYLTHLRNVRISLNGDDLRLLGIPPGPRYRKLLAELMDARLDGEVKTREDEIEYVKRAIKQT
ncbi:MAG TPA: CBS domain-containing protein [Nitrospirota bacterium]|nr:CBS domain-containing protein [Nitrospirota bacterium]